MKYMNQILILFIFAIAWACNSEPQASQPEEYNTAVEIREDAQQPAPEGLTEWQVDVIWQGKKVIGGGPFPSVDTIYLYMEDANVTVWAPGRPNAEDVKKQAKPPVKGYSLYMIQGKPRRIGPLPEK